MSTALVSDTSGFYEKLSTLPVKTYQAGDTVLDARSTTGRVMILTEGTVAVVKDGVEIAKVTEPGAVFGELSVLLDQPHSADVRAVETSQFHVADPVSFLKDPAALPYVATVLARRFNSANQTPVDLKRQIQAGHSRAEIRETVEKMEELLGGSGGCLMYAGYPFDPFARTAT
jgi:CRP/FNR family transcriptional regulator, cyclic AMP receptor protein